MKTNTYTEQHKITKHLQKNAFKCLKEINSFKNSYKVVYKATVRLFKPIMLLSIQQLVLVYSYLVCIKSF